VGKVSEKILRERMYANLEENMLINVRQHGFVQGSSCRTHLIEFFEKVSRKIDQGRAVDFVCMDFSKAFEKAPRGRLI